MNSKRVLTHATMCLGMALVLGGSLPVLAQGRAGRGNGQRGTGASGAQGAGQNGWGGPMMGPGRMGGQNDPSRSSIQELLQREDVRAHLYLNGRQKEQLDSLNQQAQTDWQTQMQSTRTNRSSLRGLSPEDRQTKMQEMQDQRQSAMLAFQNQEEGKIAAILTPAQMKRLGELDLQWRGPLSMSDAKVAEQVGLDPDQITQVKKQLTDYRALQQQTLRAQFAGVGGRGGRVGTAQTGNPPPPVVDDQTMQQRQEESQKTLAKARKAAGDKVVAFLTPEQLQTWKTLQGQHFTFRTGN